MASAGRGTQWLLRWERAAQPDQVCFLPVSDKAQLPDPSLRWPAISTWKTARPTSSWNMYSPRLAILTMPLLPRRCPLSLYREIIPRHLFSPGPLVRVTLEKVGGGARFVVQRAIPSSSKWWLAAAVDSGGGHPALDDVQPEQQDSFGCAVAPGGEAASSILHTRTRKSPKKI